MLCVFGEGQMEGGIDRSLGWGVDGGKTLVERVFGFLQIGNVGRKVECQI